MLLYFAFTLFVSASLLFLVQPMVGKMILPQLGGTPAVWNTCMVFFQAVLLVGYGYTHNLSTRCNRYWQLGVQVGILLLPIVFFTLPFRIPDNWTPPGEDNHVYYVFSVLWVLAVMVALPFFVVATSAPLLQKWFADTGHSAGKDPYFLYGASNLGSMLALLLYPAMVEPLFPTETDSEEAQTEVRKAEASVHRLTAEAQYSKGPESAALEAQVKDARKELDEAKKKLDRVTAESTARGDTAWSQPWVWTAGYALLVVLMGGCVLFVLNARGSPPETAAPPPAENQAFVASPPSVENQKTAVQPTARPSRRLSWKSLQPAPSAAAPSPHIATSRPLTMERRLRWLCLAAVPSSLMLGVTTHLTTDVAAIPFFWVIPLALYLLTFILVFARFPGLVITLSGKKIVRLPALGAWTDWPHTCVLYAQPFVLVVVVYFLVEQAHSRVLVAFTQHVTLFFLTTLMCHGELAKDRPATKDLTEFYLWMSLGGVLGGIFNVLIAPLIFWTDPIEYPLAMVCACFLRPRMIGKYMLVPGDTDAYGPTRLGRILDLVMPLLLGLWTLLLFYTALKLPNFNRSPINLLVTSAGISMFELFKMLTVVLIACMFARPMRFGLSLAVFIAIVMLFSRYENPFFYEDRDFFGFVRVRDTYTRDANDEILTDADGKIQIFRALIHGDIDHGWEKVTDSAHRRDPITYFHPQGGIGQIFEKFSWCTGGTVPERKLGTGTISSAAAAVTGTGTSFMTQVAVGQYIGNPTEGFHQVSAVTSDTALTLESAPPSAFSGSTFYIANPGGKSLPFTWPDYRVPAAMAGMGASPFNPGMGMLLQTQTEPAYAVIGLGVGTLAGHAKPFQYMRFYEIQPAVKRLSMPPPGMKPIFHFVHDAAQRGANIDIILGDGRLTLNKHQVNQYYHIIVVDAFASDAIPVHLLTKEAIVMYLTRLAEGGLLIFNTTNSYVDLKPVLRDLADHLDLECWTYGDHNWRELHLKSGEIRKNPHFNPLMSGSDWVVMQRRHLKRTMVDRDGNMVPNPLYNGAAPIPERLLPAPFPTHTWTRPEGLGGRIWTDRYSNLLRVLSWR